MYPATVPHACQVNHDGKPYTIRVDKLPVVKCRHCGEVLMDGDADRAIWDGLRKVRRLLTPEQITANIKALGITQTAFAARIGVAAESVSRWANGRMVQSRAMDLLMRMFFGLPAARDKLVTPFDPSFGSETILDAVPRAGRQQPHA